MQHRKAQRPYDALPVRMYSRGRTELKYADAELAQLRCAPVRTGFSKLIWHSNSTIGVALPQNVMLVINSCIQGKVPSFPEACISGVAPTDAGQPKSRKGILPPLSG